MCMITLIALLIGFVLGLLSHVILKSLVAPIQKLREFIGKIARDLHYYGNCCPMTYIVIDRQRYMTGKAPEQMEEAKRTLRGRGSELLQHVATIPFYDFWARRGFVPTRDKIIAASQSLTGLSNQLGDQKADRAATRKAINDALGLKLA